jgi:hypothetical protein
MNRIIIYLLVVFVAIFLCAGCGENGIFGNGGNVPSNEQCIGVSCSTGAECDTGRCECPDTSSQIRPGWCIPHDESNIFLTVDYHPEWVDTTMISFRVDPFDIDWSEVSGERYFSRGRIMYYDNAGIWSGLGHVFRPEVPGADPDSIWIYPVASDRFQSPVTAFDDWRCQRIFTGRFIGRDTIVGMLRFLSCTPGDTPIPEQVLNPTHEMMWVRLD